MSIFSPIVHDFKQDHTFKNNQYNKFSIQVYFFLTKDIIVPIAFPRRLVEYSKETFQQSDPDKNFRGIKQF